MLLLTMGEWNSLVSGPLIGIMARGSHPQKSYFA